MKQITVNAIILLIAKCIHPQHAQCPAHHDLRIGIHPTGYFQCWPTPVGDPDWDGTYLRPERSIQSGPILEGKLYCNPGTVPIVIDYRTVACR